MDEKSVLTFTNIKPRTFDKTDKSKESQSSLYYDKVSKKLIEIQEDDIRVFNRSATNLKKDLAIKLPKDVIEFVAVDKEVNYMAILVEKKKQKIIIFLNLKECCVFNIMTDNFEFLLGFFFINHNKYTNNTSQDKIICFVFPREIHFYSIVKKKKDELQKIETILVSGKAIIKNFTYNSKYKILMTVRNDRTFDFYNLTKRKFFSKAFNIVTPYLTPEQKKLARVPQASCDIEEIIRLRNVFFSRDRYTETQHYLETLYDKLYFISLCYEDNKIHICQVNSLLEDGIKEVHSIDYKKHLFCSSLQIIDNLIIVHNFVTSSFSVIDIKNQDLIISVSTNRIDFPYQNNLFINGEVFEERNDKMKGMIIYEVNFNSKTYEENIWTKIQKKDIGIKKCDVLISLLHRKNSKDIFLNLLKKMILNQEKINYLNSLYSEIVKAIVQTNPQIMRDPNQEVKRELEPYELIRLFDDFVFHKKVSVKQQDIFYSVFKGFDVESLTEKQKEFILINIILFQNQLIRENITPQPSIGSIYKFYFEKIKNKDQIVFYFSTRMFPKSEDIVQFLLSQETPNLEQAGMDMLKNMNKHKEILEFLIKKNKIMEGLSYIKDIRSSLKRGEFKELLRVLTKAKTNPVLKKIIYSTTLNDVFKELSQE